MLDTTFFSIAIQGTSTWWEASSKPPNQNTKMFTVPLDVIKPQCPDITYPDSVIIHVHQFIWNYKELSKVNHSNVMSMCKCTGEQ